MPYTIERVDGEYCVFKAGADGEPTGDALGCHATEERADAQRRALYAAEDDGKSAADGREYKTLPFDLTNMDWEGRTIEGYAAMFGNIDLGGDVIHPGAFRKTLAERGNKVRLLWQHDRGEPLGKPLEIREDERGLFIKAVISDTQRGRDALALLRDGAIEGLSIGYDAIPGGTDISKDAATGQTVRNLRELRLYEFSLVTFPMNEAAAVTALKEHAPPDPPDPLTLIEQRKEALVASLRQALADAEALVATQQTEPDAPADAGREDTASDEGAEPPQALTPEQEALRLELLSQINSQLTEE